MKTKVTVLDSFMHGRALYARNDEATFAKPEAEEMAKKGLVRIEGEAAADDVDPLGTEKMEPMTLNKMEPAAENKAAAKAKTK